MAGIKQTIPNYGVGGISEQPDELKIPGQLRNITNGMLDPIYGLRKRPGAVRVANDPSYPDDILFSLQATQADKSESVKLKENGNVPEQGKWFHYYRDEAEGSYIGQIDPDGFVRIWSVKDGTEKKIWYHAKGDGTNADSAKGTLANGSDVGIGKLDKLGSMSNYNPNCVEHSQIASITAPGREGAAALEVQPSSASYTNVDNNLRYLSGWVKQADNSYKYDEDAIQTLTINDTTFVNNRNVAVRIGSNSDFTADGYHWAYIELLRTENGRQYSLDISDDSSTRDVRRVTGIKLYSDELDEGERTGECNGIGTQVFGPINSNDFPYDKAADGYTTLTDANEDDHAAPYKDYFHIKILGGNGSDTDSDAPGIGADADAGHVFNNDQKYDSTKNENGSEWNDGFHQNGSIIGPHTEAKYEDEKRRNLFFRITTQGQQGRHYNSDQDDMDTPVNAGDYACTYNRKVDLLFGGEGYQVGDQIKVQMTTNKGGRETKQANGSSHNPKRFEMPARYVVEVTDVETVKVKANIRRIRPTPTPFDADTAVSADQILGGIAGKLVSNGLSGDLAADDVLSYKQYTSTGGDSNNAPSLTLEDKKVQIGGENLRCKIIGNGIYLFCNKKFNVTTSEKDLMRITTGEVPSIEELPLQCRHGAIVKVVNSNKAGEDDMYMKFKGQNNRDGTGAWVECLKPSVKYYGGNAVYKDDSSSGSEYTDLVHNEPTAVTWPHIIQRQADGTFLVRKYDWEKRRVGDHITNPFPSFISTEGNGYFPSMRDWDHEQYLTVGSPRYYQESTPRYINKVVLFRNRLCFLSGENVICSRPGSLGKPDFWSNTAITVSVIDPVDIAAGSQYPSDLFDAVEVPAGLLVFSSNSQFILESDDAVFGPETAKLRNISNYNYNRDVSPVSLGTSVAFLDNSNKFSRLSELANIQREQEATQIDNTLLVPTLLNKQQNLLCNSRENRIILVSKKPDIGTGQGTANSSVTDGTNTIFVNRYEIIGENNVKKISSWSRWTFKNNIKYMFIVDEDFFFLDVDNFLQKINLVEDDEDLSVNSAKATNNIHYPHHLDNWVTSTRKGTYNPTTNITTFKDFPALLKVTDPGTDLVLLDKGNGDWAHCTFTGDIDADDNQFTIEGNWSNIFTGWDIENKGSGYTSTPTATITAKSGNFTGNISAGSKVITNPSNITDYATGSKIETISGSVSSVTLPAGGATVMKIYNNEVTLDTAFTGSGSATGATLNWQCPGQGASITPIITDGKLTDFELVEQGYNYSVAPTITISGGGGSNAIVTSLADRTLTAGYLFEMDVDFPTIYPTRQVGQSYKSDLNGSLTLHRINLNFGKVGTYETTLTRVGKDSYTDIHESRPASLYEISDVPYVESDTKTIPIYEKNKNVSITLKSKYPSPATLNSLTWEGDFNTRNYRRV